MCFDNNRNNIIVVWCPTLPMRLGKKDEFMKRFKFLLQNCHQLTELYLTGPNSNGKDISATLNCTLIMNLSLLVIHVQLRHPT